MKPKEKAEELLEKFKNRSIELGNTHSQLMAEANALIAVDEIIKAIPDASDDNSPYNSELLWWKEVRHEIENLKNK